MKRHLHGKMIECTTKEATGQVSLMRHCGRQLESSYKWHLTCSDILCVQRSTCGDLKISSSVSDGIRTGKDKMLSETVLRTESRWNLSSAPGNIKDASCDGRCEKGGQFM